MKTEDIGWVSSLPYSTELIDKSYSLPAKIKDLLTLLNNHLYQDKEIPAFECEVIDELRREILNDLFYICHHLNRPEILDDRMIRFYVTQRYGWSGRGLEHRDQKRISSSAGVLRAV